MFTPSTEDNGPLPPLVEGASDTVTGAAAVSITPSSDPYDFPDLALVTSASGQQSFATAGDTGAFATPQIDSALYTQDSRVSVGADALQSYTWNGTGPATRTISATLTLSQSGGWPANGGSAGSVGMVVFTTGSNTADFTCGDMTYANGGNFCVKNGTILSQSLLTETTSLNNATIDLNLPSFQLTQPGETVFVLASTDFFGNGGGYMADPLVTTISNETGLRPTSAPEIDPAGAFGALTLLGGCLLVLRSRRAIRPAA